MQEPENITSIPSNRLQFFPVMMFAIVMGFSGLSLVLNKMHEVLYFPSFIASIFTFLSTILFLVILFFYIKKFIVYKKEVRKEFIHPNIGPDAYTACSARWTRVRSPSYYLNGDPWSS